MHESNHSENGDTGLMKRSKNDSDLKLNGHQNVILRIMYIFASTRTKARIIIVIQQRLLFQLESI